MPEVFERLKALGVTHAGLVDANTWGHVRFEKEAAKNNITPMFGMEIPIKSAEQSKYKQSAWILARDTSALYHATSKSIQNTGLTAEEFENLEGVVRFCGAAMDRLAPEQYDYIDVCPQSLLLAAKAVALHRRTGVPLVLTGYNDYPAKEHQSFAYAWEVGDAVGLRTIEGLDGLWEVLQYVMTEEEFKYAAENSIKIATGLEGIKLKKAPIIHLAGDMVKLAREGQQYRLKAGHIDEWTQEYEERFVEEIKQIQGKDFDSYFLVVADLIRYAKTVMLVGPARGSSAGSLVCYCMGITEVDPLPHKLLFQRFIDISRADLPDIDIDFADNKRYLVFEYLQEKYGPTYVSKMGNINTLKSASVMEQVRKKFLLDSGLIQGVRNAEIVYSSGDARYGKGLQDTFDLTEPGQNFQKKYAAAARCMSDLEIHPSHTGVHAAAILVCNDEITDYCTVNSEGVAQIDKPDSEYLNLLKIDALGLRTLGIIEDCHVVTHDQLYGLKLNDPEVFKVINEDRVTGIFQFEGSAVRSVTRSVNVDKFSKIDNLTALARPGPLASGMAQKYIKRASGQEPVEYEAPQLEPYLKDTYGVFLYQEQIMAVVKEIGNFDWVKTSAVRKAMSGRKGEEYFNKQGEDFVKGAMENGLEEGKAKEIWQAMVTFGSWGFNKSHSVSYAIITYWTCWLKRYFPLEFAAACLRTAKDDIQTISYLRELDKEGIKYTPIDPEFSEMNWSTADGRLIGGIMNAKGYGPVKSLRYITARNNGTLKPTDIKNLMKAEVKFKDLKEMHTKFGHFYDDPTLVGVTSDMPIKQMAEVKDGKRKGDVLLLGKLVKKILADENEGIRIKKRGGKRIEDGKPTQFIDLMCVDDSADNPIRFRIRPDLFERFGRQIAENDPKGSFYLLKGWKIHGIDMYILKNIKRIGIGTEDAEQPEQLDVEEVVQEIYENEKGEFVSEFNFKSNDDSGWIE